MKLRLEFVKEAEKKSEETSFTIEIQRQRGDVWNTTDSKSLPEGEKLELNVPRDARIMLVGPGADTEVVYDQEQKAAVRQEKNPPVVAETRAPPDRPANTPNQNLPPSRQTGAVSPNQPSTQTPNVQPGRTTSPPAQTGSGIAKPGEPAKPTGVSNQQTIGSPSPSTSPSSAGTTSTDTLKKGEEGKKPEDK